MGHGKHLLPARKRREIGRATAKGEAKILFTSLLLVSDLINLIYIQQKSQQQGHLVLDGAQNYEHIRINTYFSETKNK